MRLIGIALLLLGLPIWAAETLDTASILKKQKDVVSMVKIDDLKASTSVYQIELCDNDDCNMWEAPADSLGALADYVYLSTDGGSQVSGENGAYAQRLLAQYGTEYHCGKNKQACVLKNIFKTRKLRKYGVAYDEGAAITSASIEGPDSPRDIPYGGAALVGASATVTAAAATAAVPIADTASLSALQGDPATALRRTTDLLGGGAVYLIDVCLTKDVCDRFYTRYDKLPALADYALLYALYMPDDLIKDDRVSTPDKPIHEKPLRFVQQAKRDGTAAAILAAYQDKYSCKPGKNLPRCVVAGLAGELRITESKVVYDHGTDHSVVAVWLPDTPGKMTD